MTFLVVTGTGTEIGKTIVTAAVAVGALSRGDRVAVVKPAQTGIEPGEDSDVEVVGRLSGLADLHELARYPEPLAPATAARRAGMKALSMRDAASSIVGLAERDLVIVEGAGGVLVRLDDEDATIADLARDLDAPVLVVSSSGLGSLNAAALTCQAVRDRGLRCLGVVFGSWPREPGLAELANLEDIASYAGAPLVGLLPQGSGQLAAAEFKAVALGGLAAELGGRWDPANPLGLLG